MLYEWKQSLISLPLLFNPINVPEKGNIKRNAEHGTHVPREAVSKREQRVEIWMRGAWKGREEGERGARARYSFPAGIHSLLVTWRPAHGRRRSGSGFPVPEAQPPLCFEKYPIVE